MRYENKCVRTAARFKPLIPSRLPRTEAGLPRVVLVPCGSDHTKWPPQSTEGDCLVVDGESHRQQDCSSHLSNQWYHRCRFQWNLLKVQRFIILFERPRNMSVIYIVPYPQRRQKSFWGQKRCWGQWHDTMFCFCYLLMIPDVFLILEHFIFCSIQVRSQLCVCLHAQCPVMTKPGTLLTVSALSFRGKTRQRLRNDTESAWCWPVWMGADTGSFLAGLQAFCWDLGCCVKEQRSCTVNLSYAMRWNRSSEKVWTHTSAGAFPFDPLHRVDRHRGNQHKNGQARADKYQWRGSENDPPKQWEQQVGLVMQ